MNIEKIINHFKGGNMAAVQQKYNEVVDLVNQHTVEGKKIQEENGVLKIWATVNDQSQKDKIWTKIKEIGGREPSDLIADIKVKNAGSTQDSQSAENFETYTVKSGDTLSAISKQYLGDANRYNEIAKLNNIANPDRIDVGQKLKIPKK